MAKKTISVPGKFILAGEHAVVYGHPAIIYPLDKLKLTLTLEFSKLNKDQMLIDGKTYTYPTKKLADDFPLLNYGWGYLRSKYPHPNHFFHLTIKSDIPQGSGLGSSASLSVALVKAWYEINKLKIDKAKMFDDIMAMETFQHNHPSGADPTCIFYDQPVYFIKRQPEQENQIDFCNPIDLKIFNLNLIDTGQPRETTGQMVELVRNNLQKNTKILVEIDKLTKRLKLVLDSEKMTHDLINTFYANLNLIGQKLEDIGVVSDAVRKFSTEVRSLGGAIKISGAGGLNGGSGLVLVAGLQNNILKKLTDKYNYELL